MQTKNIPGIMSSGSGRINVGFKFSFTATFGAIAALNGTAVTQSVPGLLVGDIVHVICASPPPAGLVIANARVSAADTLEIFFTTSVAVGITLGSLNFSGISFR